MKSQVEDFIEFVLLARYVYFFSELPEVIKLKPSPSRDLKQDINVH